MIKYLIPFLTAFSITILLIVLGIYFGKKIKWIGRASERHVHNKTALRIGGAAMIIAFNLAILFNRDLVITLPLYGVMAASIILLLAGIRDDWKEMSWRTQLIFQISAVIAVFICGVRIYYVTNPLNGGIINLNLGIGVFFSAMLVLVWTILIMNSMNWIDGIDGVAGGVTFIGALTIFILSLKPEVNQPPMAILAMILAGSSLGFLIFNFNPSRVMAGTAGSMFMGFTLAVLAIFAGTKIATSALVLSVPVVDFLWVIGERIKNKKSIFEPDTNHLHHKLLGMGWSQSKIAVYFYAITAAIAVVALNTRVTGKAATLFAVCLILLVFLFILDRKIRTKKDLIVTGGSRSIGTSKSTKKIIFIASMIVICLGLLFFARHGSDRISVQENKEQSIIVDGNRWKVETAVTPAEREQGLSGRPSLCRGCGMLFIFENKGPYRFWMKDMNFDLDMLWIADGKIVQIDKDIPYIGGTSIIRSSTVPIDEVLEINAGESEQLGIKIGDELKYSD